jgi:uncharacterized protein (TIGR00288 family)
LRPTSDGDEQKTTENQPADSYEPASLSQHTEELPEAQPADAAAPAQDWASPAPARRDAWPEDAAEPVDEGFEGEDSDGDEGPDDESEGDEEAGEGGEAGEAGGTPGSAERKRRRRGGRRRRGRNGATPAIAAEPAEAAAENGERKREERPARERFERPRIAELPPVDLERAGERYSREIIVSVPDRAQQAADERKIALFCDLENVALGVRDSDVKKFDINMVLERLLEKGKIIVKKAYADWERYSEYKRAFHEAAIELIDIPQKFYSGKNSADIKMVVDAMDLSYSKEHLDTFVILSGDSDFSPLVSKLKENNKYVIGVGVKNSSSNLLIANCDEFLYYEDVWRDQQQVPQIEGLSKKQAECFNLMIDSIQALLRENKDVLWGSMIKQTMQRKKPSFNESYYGYSAFSELLEDAERRGLVKLKKDQRSGSYVVTGFAGRK